MPRHAQTIDVLGRELRTLGEGALLRDAADGITFRGHAAKFNRRTWIGPRSFGFWEQVGPQAFDKTLSEANVRFLYNHDPDALLATTASHSLRLTTDGDGLVAEADLDPDDIDVQRIVPKLRTGKLNKMSFAFEVVKDSIENLADGTQLRTLDEVRLWDVSVVTFPAYEDTDAGLRGAAWDSLCSTAGIADSDRGLLVRSLLTQSNDPQVLPILRSLGERLTQIGAPRAENLGVPEGFRDADWTTVANAVAELDSRLEPAETTQDEAPEPGSSTRADDGVTNAGTPTALRHRHKSHAVTYRET